MELKNIVVDRGNSSIKAGLFYGGKLAEERVFLTEEDTIRWINERDAGFLLVSTVGKDFGEALQSIPKRPKLFFLSSHTPLPFRNLYSSPETLGVDRLAGIAGAFSMFPGENCLVVDAGTCLTYDFIDRSGNYWGGSISPGLKMRFKALHHFTERLPLVDLDKEDVLLTGDNTKNSILSGVLHGVVSEVEGIISSYRRKHGELKVLMCGGDTIFFESKLKAHIFAVANLVLVGLNSILLFNIKDFEADN